MTEIFIIDYLHNKVVWLALIINEWLLKQMTNIIQLHEKSQVFPENHQ